MRLNSPLDKILNNEVKVRALRILCQSANEMSGRQMAKLVRVTPRTAHGILQDLLKEGIVTMRSAGKSYLFHLNEDRVVVKDVLKPLFIAENILHERLFDMIRTAIKKSAIKDGILSVAVFGSVYAKTEKAMSDVDLLVIVKTSDLKKQAEDLFFELDQQISSQWGNLISPYVNSLSEFKSKANKQTGIVPNIINFYQLIYGDRLEKLLR